jgi:hypothetical protein
MAKNSEPKKDSNLLNAALMPAWPSVERKYTMLVEEKNYDFFVLFSKYLRLRTPARAALSCKNRGKTEMFRHPGKLLN